VLLNPWVRTEVGQARTVLRHYYLDRLMQPSFWRKVLKLQFNPWVSLRSAAELLRRTRRNKPAAASLAEDPLAAALPRNQPLPDRMLAGFSRFRGPVIMVMSGRDLIAREFDELLRDSPPWRERVAAKEMTRHDIIDADHTFSSDKQRNQVVTFALNWLRSW
jgi:uncharacterized protein